MNGVSVKGLWKDFDGTPVLKDVNLEVPDGECLVLLGPSGCGKTTTLRCIAGLETPAAGEIILDGVPVFGEAGGVDVPPKNRQIGFVFQNYAIYPHMSVYKNVAFRMRLRHFPSSDIRQSVLEALRLVDLEGFEDRSLRSQLMSLQRKVGSTMIYVTHDQSEAMLIADRIAVMEKGQILQVGTPEEIYALPQTVTVAALTGELKTNLIEGEVHNAEERILLVPAADPWLFIRLQDDCRRLGGEKVVFNVRPEDLEVLPLPDEGEGNARVLAVMPRGTDYLVHLRIGERLQQIVATGTAADCARLQPGQAVGVRFRRGTIYDAPTGRLVSAFGYDRAGRARAGFGTSTSGVGTIRPASARHRSMSFINASGSPGRTKGCEPVRMAAARSA